MQTLVNDQREEARSAREHVRNLQKIREDAQQQETDLLLNRDFRGLFSLRRQTTQRLREEDQSYQDQRSERRIALADELQDQIDQYARQREQRIAQYEQDQKDAHAVYLQERREAQRETAQKILDTRNAHTQELTELRQNLTQGLLMRRQAWIQELQTQSQTAQQQVTLEQQKQTALLTIARKALASVNGLTGGGGGLSGLAGAISNATNTQNSAAFTQTNNINGNVANPQALVNLIEQRTLKLIDGIFS